jgi:putative redox protein
MPAISVTATSQTKSLYKTRVTARDHSVISDVPVKYKGADKGMTPHEMLLGALAACTAMTIEAYAVKKKWSLTSVEVTVTETQIATAQEKGPAVKKPHMAIVVKVFGELTAEQVNELQTLATCPIHKLLEEDKVITKTCTLATKA